MAVASRGGHYWYLLVNAGVLPDTPQCIGLRSHRTSLTTQQSRNILDGQLGLRDERERSQGWLKFWLRGWVVDGINH